MLASSFGLIYSLDAAAQQLLVDVLHRSMQDHGLEPVPREAAVSSEVAVLSTKATSVKESMLTSLMHEAQAGGADDASETPDEEYSDYGSSSSDDDYSLQIESDHMRSLVDGTVVASTEETTSA